MQKVKIFEFINAFAFFCLPNGCELVSRVFSTNMYIDFLMYLHFIIIAAS